MANWLRHLKYRFSLGSALAVFVAVPAVALLLSGCENVSGFDQKSLVRVIDASYNAPAIDVYTGSDLIASNIAQGVITNYAQFDPSTRVVKVTEVTSNKALISTTGTFRAGHQHSVFVTDYNSQYQVVLLDDQTTPAPTGKVSMRFLVQTPSTGAVDIYLIPDGSKLEDTKALMANVPVGTNTGYLNVPAGNLTMEITPTGSTTPTYISQKLNFAGGEVRTYLLVDAQLTTNPPINVYTGKDVN